MGFKPGVKQPEVEARHHTVSTDRGGATANLAQVNSTDCGLEYDGSWFGDCGDLRKERALLSIA